MHRRALPAALRAMRLAPAALALVAAIAGCGGGDRPSALLITLDTTRADRIGAYGDPDARTPFLDALARRGVQERFAFVDSPTTLPSHTTMLTGAASLRHGVRLNDAFALGPGIRTLGEAFRDHGYATAAVVSSVTLAADRGLGRGFDRYDDAMPAEFTGYDPALAERTKRFVGTQRRADGTREAAERALASLSAPAFLWVHFVDAHLTYDPPPPWDRLPASSPYDGEIAYADRDMGRVVRRAEERLGPCAIVVIADHGEGLGDHHEDEHGMFLYDATVRVPFVTAAPGRPGGGIGTAPAFNADVAPTLLAAAGITGESFPDGMDRAAAADGDGAARGILSETITPTRFHGGSRLKALRAAGWKYVLAPESELYDVGADPGELRDLAAADPDRAASLRERLIAAVEEIDPDPATAPAVPLTVGPAQAEALRALGYLGAGRPVPTAPETEPSGLDSKDLIDVTRSLRYVMDGRYDEARPRMARWWGTHAAEPPDDSWDELYARAHLVQAFLELTDLSRREGHGERARPHLAAALRLDPGYGHARALLARLNEREGRPADAPPPWNR